MTKRDRITTVVLVFLVRVVCLNSRPDKGAAFRVHRPVRPCEIDVNVKAVPHGSVESLGQHLGRRLTRIKKKNSRKCLVMVSRGWGIFYGENLTTAESSRTSECFGNQNLKHTVQNILGYIVSFSKHLFEQEDTPSRFSGSS